MFVKNISNQKYFESLDFEQNVFGLKCFWQYLFNDFCCLKVQDCGVSFFKWTIPGFFLFIFVFSIQLTENVQYKFCRWLDSNRGSLAVVVAQLVERLLLNARDWQFDSRFLSFLWNIKEEQKKIRMAHKNIHYCDVIFINFILYDVTVNSMFCQNWNIKRPLIPLKANKLHWLATLKLKSKTKTILINA